MIGRSIEITMKEMPNTKKAEISGLMIHVDMTPIIETCPKLIAIIGIVAHVAAKDALILAHKRSGMNGLSRLYIASLKSNIPNNAE